MPTANRTEYLAINSVPLATAAWWIRDLTPIWDAASVRGSDRLIPMTDGQAPLRRRKDVLHFQLAMVIIGKYDSDGSPASNPRVQLLANMDYIRTNVLAPNTSSPYTRTLVYHEPNGSSTRTAQCIVVPPFQPVWLTDRGTALQGVLDIWIPSGTLS